MLGDGVRSSSPTSAPVSSFRKKKSKPKMQELEGGIYEIEEKRGKTEKIGKVGLWSAMGNQIHNTTGGAIQCVGDNLFKYTRDETNALIERKWGETNSILKNEAVHVLKVGVGGIYAIAAIYAVKSMVNHIKGK